MSSVCLSKRQYFVYVRAPVGLKIYKSIAVVFLHVWRPILMISLISNEMRLFLPLFQSSFNLSVIFRKARIQVFH